MYEDNTTAHQSFVDEATGGGEVDEEVGIVDILNRDPQMPVPGRGVVGRYGLASDRHYMGNTALCEDPGRLRGVNPGWASEVSSPLSGTVLSLSGIEKTYVPRNNLPSMTGLIFLQVAMSE